MHVARGERVGGEVDVAAAVRDVMPQQTARQAHIVRLAQAKARDVLDLALRVFRREVDVLDDGIERIVGIELAKRAPRQLLVGLIRDCHSRINDNSCDARLGERRPSQHRHGDHNAGQSRLAKQFGPDQ